MAVKKTKHFNIIYTHNYVCDTEADKDRIPGLGFGDLIFVIESNQNYIVNGKGEIVSTLLT